MLAIVNARGVPGIVGAVVRMPSGGRCLLTCHHVLFGRGAGIGDRLWAMEEGMGRRKTAEVGRAAGGWIGSVTHEGQACFVDCGIAALDGTLARFVRDALGETTRVTGPGRAQVGARVWKNARITGVTYGVVVDVAHYDRPFIEGQSYEAPGQLLIRPEDPDKCFSAAGESGAAVVDEQDRVVGFLWGLNPCGEGIAFPAAAALQYLGVSLDGVTPHPLPTTPEVRP